MNTKLQHSKKESIAGTLATGRKSQMDITIRQVR